MLSKFVFIHSRALFLVISLLAVSPVTNVSAEEETATPTPTVEKTEYVLENLQGDDIQVLEDGSGKWEKAQEGQVLEAGDEVKTGEGSQATLMLQSETSVHFNATSDMKVDRIEPTEEGGFLSRLKLLAGRVLADVKKKLQESHSTFEMESNGVICGVRGTAFEMETNGKDVEARAHEGEVEVKSDGKTDVLGKGHAFAFKNGKFSAKRRLTRSETKGFKKWRSLRKEVFKKRMERLNSIGQGRMKPWTRQHPRMNRDMKGLKDLKGMRDRKNMKDRSKDGKKDKGKNPLEDLGGLHLGL